MIQLTQNVSCSKKGKKDSVSNTKHLKNRYGLPLQGLNDWNLSEV